MHYWFWHEDLQAWNIGPPQRKSINRPLTKEDGLKFNIHNWEDYCWDHDGYLDDKIPTTPPPLINEECEYPRCDLCGHNPCSGWPTTTPNLMMLRDDVPEHDCVSKREGWEVHCDFCCGFRAGGDGNNPLLISSWGYDIEGEPLPEFLNTSTQWPAAPLNMAFNYCTQNWEEHTGQDLFWPMGT